MAHQNWEAMQPKIESAFTKLKEQGIRAEMNFSITLTDGISEIWDDSFEGYAFYHEQDTERAEESGELVVAYGSMKPDASETDILSAGRLVKQALEAEGLYVDWLEDPESRIYVYLSEEAKNDIDNEVSLPNDPAETHDIESTEQKAEAAAQKLKVSGSDILTIAECDELLEKSGGNDINTFLYARGDKQGKPAIRMPYYNVLFDGVTNFCMFGGPEEVRLATAQALKAELEDQGLTVTSTTADLIGFKVPEKT